MKSKAWLLRKLLFLRPVNETMIKIFADKSFYGAEIMEVKEITFDRTIDFVLTFPADSATNTFERRILRFKDAILYVKKEIPRDGYPYILEIKYVRAHKHTYMNNYGVIETSNHKVEIVTNTGSRFIEFSDVELL